MVKIKSGRTGKDLLAHAVQYPFGEPYRHRDVGGNGTIHALLRHQLSRYGWTIFGYVGD